MTNGITVQVNGRAVSVPEGSMVSTAVAMAGLSMYRKSVKAEPRGPLCGMGICFECRVTIDGQPHYRGCQTVCRPGMEITTDAP